MEVIKHLIKIKCITPDCTGENGRPTTSHRTILRLTEKNKRRAYEAFETGTQINAKSRSTKKLVRWKKTKAGWICEDCMK